MGNSTLITKHLTQIRILPDLNEKLSQEDKGHKARDLATRALLEDKLHFFHAS